MATTVEFLVGEKRFAPPRYFVRDLKLPGEVVLGAHAAGMQLEADPELPPGVLESRCSDGTVISRLTF